MTRVVVVCVAGASSTFLARRLSVLSDAAGLDWNVTAGSADTIAVGPDCVVAVSHHVATTALRHSLAERGIRFVVLGDGVSGGFGAEAALETISQFLDHDSSVTSLTAGPTSETGMR